MEDLAVVGLGYLIGSIPFAFLLARRRGVDLRRTGSRNLGAANVLRTTGPVSALAAASLDMAKGAAAVLAADALASSPPARVGAALAAVIGHMHPLWLRFRGGKGVATAAGSFAILAPAAAALAAGVFAAVVWMTRYVSVGSLAAAGGLVVGVWLSGASSAVRAGAVGVALLVAFGHRGNLSRLVSGTEARLGERIS